VSHRHLRRRCAPAQAAAVLAFAVAALAAAVGHPVAAAGAHGRSRPAASAVHLGSRRHAPSAPTTSAYQGILPPSAFLAFGSGFAHSASAASFVAHSADVTAFAPWGFALLADGAAAERGGGPVAPLVAAAHRAGRAVIPLFTNAFENDAILVNPAAEAAAIANLVAIVRIDGLDGVNIDFEGLNPVDRLPLDRFVARVASRLHPLGRIVTVSVGPQWASEPAAYRVYDYRALGQAADRVVLMTYDEHCNPGAPGPVAGLPWVRRVVDYALSQMPAAKIYLGLADYGYDWYGASAPTVTASQALAVAAAVGAPIRWSALQGEAYFTYTGSGGATHVVWFEDGASEAIRIRLAESAHLGGLALWQLGGEDPGTWRAIAAYHPAAPIATSLR
jgi:spore germination protein